MKLKELLNVTCVDTVIKVQGIKDRVKIDLITVNCVTEYNRTDLTSMNESIEKYGDNEVLHQYVEHGKLVILIKLI